MCDTTFTFGQRGNHFFQCPSRQDYTQLPSKLATFLTSSQLQKVHHVTLGFENSYLLIWRDTAGYDRIESHELPLELTNFLYAKTAKGTLLRNLPSIRLTLGPYNTSFFVTDNSACLWMNLPLLLLSALQSRIQNGTWIDKPRLVALGANANFLLLTENHAAVWDLSNYATLSQMLEFSKTPPRGIEEVANVALHAYRYQCFVVQSRNGTLLYENIAPHEVAAVQAMQTDVLNATKVVQMSRQKERRMLVERRSTSFVGRRPSLRPQVSVRSEFSEGGQRHEVKAQKQAKGLKLSLSLSVSARGLAGGFGLGRMLG